MTEVTTHKTEQRTVPVDGNLTLPLTEGLYTIRVSCVGFHLLDTKPFAIREGHVVRLQLLLGADY